MKNSIAFNNWLKEDYEEASIPYVEVMTCKDYNKRYWDKGNLWIAQEKLDGHRAICILTENGYRFFSRRISKKTNWFSENSDCIPHLRDAEKSIPIGTILDGELILPGACTSSDVQSVTGALPAKAIAYQAKHGLMCYKVFDVVQVNQTLSQRLAYLGRLNLPSGFDLVPYVLWQPRFGIGFESLLTEVWAEGKEGLVLKELNSLYEQGKRSAFWLKRKEVQTYDVIICGFQSPEKLYTGTEPEKHQYRIDNILVTKPFYNGWIGAIEFGLLKDGKLIKTGEAKGITDADQEFIKKNKKKLIGTVIEIKAQGIIDQDTLSLRHPRFNRWRPDKNPEECTWIEL